MCLKNLNWLLVHTWLFLSSGVGTARKCEWWCRKEVLWRVWTNWHKFVWNDWRNKKLSSRYRTCGQNFDPRISKTRKHITTLRILLWSTAGYTKCTQFSSGQDLNWLHQEAQLLWHNTTPNQGAQVCREVANETANCRRSRASISPGFKHNGIDP